MPVDTTKTKLDKNESSVYREEPAVYNKVIQAAPAPEREIGIDTKQTMYQNIIQAGTNNLLDISSLDAFTNISQSRDQVYALLDTMCQDSTVAAVLETYAEDATEPNDQGQIVWVEASNPDVQKYVQFLLDAMNVDKNIYKWTYSLCKYGDIYLRLYRESDFEEADLFNSFKNKKKTALNEAVKIKAYSKNDHYVNYMEMHSNPAEIFELTKLGKTYAYIKAHVNSTQTFDSVTGYYQANNLLSYRFKQSDVELHSATDFVHGCLEDNSSRTPETVQIFIGDSDKEADALTYTVKRGQSLLYNTFKTWRELQLLENSVLLNRITKSSIVRVIGVEVGDMPKEMVGPHLQGIKSLIEQKAAINAGNSINEYTNPGPIENNIYVPTHEGVGAITASQIGGDVDVKSLADLDYYQDKWFGSLRVPKQYFGVTDDNAGFSGGQSLSIISSRYGKMVKRIQSTMTQVLTDAVNLLLLDRNLKTYVNEFNIRMLAPTTQEELDRRENLSNKVGVTTDIMNMLGDIDDSVIKLKIMKSLLSKILTDGEVIDLIQQQIDNLEEQQEAENNPEETTDDIDLSDDSSDMFADTSSEPSEAELDLGLGVTDNSETDLNLDSGEETIEPMDTGATLPTPDELGVDMTTFEG